MINHCEDDDMTIEREISDVSTEEIHEYMGFLRHDDSFGVKFKRIWDLEITDPLKLAELYDEMQVYDARYPTQFPQRVYIIESDDDAISFTPVERTNGEITYRIQLLDKANRYIKEKYWERIDRKRDIRRIPFVKL